MIEGVSCMLLDDGSLHVKCEDLITCQQVRRKATLCISLTSRALLSPLNRMAKKMRMQREFMLDASAGKSKKMLPSTSEITRLPSTVTKKNSLSPESR